MEVQRDGVCLNTIEQVLDESIVQFLFVQTETQRGNTLVEHIQRLGVRLASVSTGADVLANSPFVVCLCTAHIGELPGRGSGSFQTFKVFTTVERLHVEAFRSAPNEFLLEVGTFQVGHDFLLPYFCRDGGKISQQIQFFFCHDLN